MNSGFAGPVSEQVIEQGVAWEIQSVKADDSLKLVANDHLLHKISSSGMITGRLPQIERWLASGAF